MGTFIAILILATLALVLIATAGAFSRVTRTATRSFRCPFADRDVTADFQEDVWGGTAHRGEVLQRLRAGHRDHMRETLSQNRVVAKR